MCSKVFRLLLSHGESQCFESDRRRFSQLTVEMIILWSWRTKKDSRARWWEHHSVLWWKVKENTDTSMVSLKCFYVQRVLSLVLTYYILNVILYKYSQLYVNKYIHHCYKYVSSEAFICHVLSTRYTSAGSQEHHQRVLRATDLTREIITTYDDLATEKFTVLWKHINL